MRSSSRLAPVHDIMCTLSWRIISAREIPSSAVLMAPAREINIFFPEARWASYPFAASTNAAALKCKKCVSMKFLISLAIRGGIYRIVVYNKVLLP